MHKKYHQFCTMQGLKQHIQCLTQVVCSTSNLIGQVSFQEFFQIGAINVGLSGHQLIFRTRKVSKFKTCCVHKHIKANSLNNDRVQDYKKSLRQIAFPNEGIFDNVNAACSDFFLKIMAVIDKITSFKTKQAKEKTQKWREGEVLEKIIYRDKLFQKFKKSRLHIYKELFKKAKYEA